MYKEAPVLNNTPSQGMAAFPARHTEDRAALRHLGVVPGCEDSRDGDTENSHFCNKLPWEITIFNSLSILAHGSKI